MLPNCNPISGDIEEWSNTLQLHFNHTKCYVLTLGKFENICYAHNYTILGNALEHVSEEKDLGITIDVELNFKDHVSGKIRIANGIVGLIRRSFSYLDCETFRRLYCAFVRPHLEYGHAVWSPSQKYKQVGKRTDPSDHTCRWTFKA